MKQLATIGTVVLLLLGSAIYFGQRQPVQEPVVATPATPAPIKTTTPQPLTRMVADGTLKLESAVAQPYLNVHGDDQFAVFDITATNKSHGVRAPLNVAVVIDRSGSMDGVKIENAKSAARRMVNVLSEHDRLAIVSYGSDATVNFASAPMTAENRMSALAAIDRVAVGGGTNLSGGFQLGYGQVQQHKTPDTVNRILLTSDGNANVGMTDQDRLVALSRNALDKQTSVSTIGVGLDYNEDLMTQMANSGAGNYYFVDRPSQIVTFLHSEVMGLASTVAKNATLHIKLADGVELAELHGFSKRQYGNNIHVDLSAFHREQAKNIVMKLKVRPRSGLGSNTPVSLYTATLTYDDLVKDRESTQQVALGSLMSADQSLIASNHDVAVIARVSQVEMAQSMQKAMEEYGRGNRGAGNAVLDKAVKKLDSATSKYSLPQPKRYKKARRGIISIRDSMNSPEAEAPAVRKRQIKKSKGWSNDVIQSEVVF